MHFSVTSTDFQLAKKIAHSARFTKRETFIIVANYIMGVLHSSTTISLCAM